MKTTLNKIREKKPCEESWKKLLTSLGKTDADDTEVTIRYILDLLGVKDAIWALRAVEGHDKEIRLFACDCAESVLPFYGAKYPDDNRPRTAIEVSRRHANGEATEDELAAAWDAAWEAAWDAAWEAARAAWGLRGLRGMLRGLRGKLRGLRGKLRGMLRGLLRGLLRGKLRGLRGLRGMLRGMLN
jgi:hypothetical protein